MAPPGQRIDGLILAGGQSTRMRTPGQPDTDKGLLLWRGRPLVAWVHDFLREQNINEIFVSTNRHTSEYAAYGQILPDDTAYQGCGPLAGILSGLRHMDARWLFVLPVDVLRWPPDLLRRLAAAARPGHPAFARTPNGPHPLCLVTHRAMTPSLEAFLDAGGRQVLAWVRHCHAQTVDFPADDCLINLNTPQDWTRWENA